MRSLNLKLTLAFVFVSLAGIVLTAIIVQQRMRSEFDRFLFRQTTEDLTLQLAEYYRLAGSWQGIESLLGGTPGKEPALDHSEPDNASPGISIPDGKRAWDRRAPLIVTDAQGVIVYGPQDRLGKKAPPQDLDSASPLELDGAVIGWLVAGASLDFNPLEKLYLENVSHAILVSALVAAAIALLLGSTLARTLTRPLRELTNATRVISQGELGHQVEVRSKDELGDLAASFNQMSTDLARSHRLRNEMTANIAHDLRTPLSLILGYTEALSDGKLQGDAEIYAVMHQEAGHLNHLIDDLRLISLADAGELPLNLQSISPITLLERAAAAFKPQAQQNQISLQVEAALDLPPVQVDPDRMAQILGNLISNALRYTPQGGWIKLSAASAANILELKIQDNGAGIAPDDLPFVFARFYRGDKSRQQNGEAGLGLTIAKSLVEAHHGSIRVESAPGQGTCFMIQLPIL